MKNSIKQFFLYPLATVCVICPICIYTRKKPKSEVSKKLVALEKGCPFCYAYATVRREKK